MKIKRLAIMKDVSLGCRDIGKPCIWFNTYITECDAALQILSWESAAKLIETAGVYDARSLEGKACWVEEDNGLIRFVEYAKI